MAPASDELPVGTRLARHYVIREKLGYGGMAQIYRAQHDTTDEYVAVKVLGRELITERKVVKRFLREARTSATIRHDHIVEIIDLGETRDGRPFMVMELLEGEDLGFTLRRMGSLSWERTKPMLLQVLGALQAAHTQGVIHRDIKPENIFRITRDDTDDYLKVFDFGIAKVLYGDEVSMAQPLTADGVVLGTPAYMSPEQCLCQSLDARSDLYAVGVLGYEMLAGRPPFDGDESATLMFQHIYEPIPAISAVSPNIEIPPPVEAIIRKALEKRPANRFQSAAEMAAAVRADEYRDNRGIWSRIGGMFRRGRRR